ncbi:catalase/peroxidase HPI [Vibrio genomosp. F10 str. ZF-129]|uniref:Catalase-peroxidase n=1 Tax=Vibrio genomosp. F10 str. ZF-129 TaxID=1187848 RepID=A0A1E5BB59_9VIBR|nr:catalase/peroxidase HPI [Vibrio genomosp. F10]OEE31249.1 catalase/peroxidase HPI [Vibrio genomosp. F10 str. ZF-129]
MNTSEKLTRSTNPILIPLTALAILITLVAVVFWATVLFAAPVAAPKGDITKNKLGSADASYSNNEGKSASHSQAKHAKSNQFWWPDQLDLSPLRDHDLRSNPLGEDFDYKLAFSDIDLVALKKDINATLTDSQQWWPADWGNYGPFFIRMAWHSAGTYRTLDGRGGASGAQQRFAPLNSWPDNASLDKARRLLWPVKKKYGESISWGDLIVLAGNVSLENMGFTPYGFAAGRTDDWEPDTVYWGPELEMLASDRRNEKGELIKPLAAAHMGLIYVNPEGPNGVPDPLASAKSIREAFGRMSMNDEETMALVAGGHTFGKMHGAHKSSECLGAEPEAASIEQQGLGWQNKCGKGHSEDTITSGLEGAWTQAPTSWTSLYLQNLLNFEWEQVHSPAGAIQWVPTDESLHESVPDAHVKGKFNPPVMTTADLAFKFDPEYKKIAEHFLADPDAYRLSFAKAWFKLTHRDMGPRSHYLGDDFPDEAFIWQDPIATPDYTLVNDKDIADLKQSVLGSELTVPELINVAWGSASSYRDSDRRGGANGARIALEPQKNWAVNNPEQLKRVITELKSIQSAFNQSAGNQPTKGNKQVSLADLIVLGGAVAIEKAAEEAGVNVTVPFTPGRADATQQNTDVASFAVLEPHADGFRNFYEGNFYQKSDDQSGYSLSPVEALVDKADQLTLTIPEMTVLIGGMRALNTNTDRSSHGVFTDQPGTLNNDYFVHLLDMSIQWRKAKSEGIYEGVELKTGKVKYTATPVDLIFGSNSELRAVAEVYAFDNAKNRFVTDFVQAWVKVMQLDLERH